MNSDQPTKKNNGNFLTRTYWIVLTLLAIFGFIYWDHYWKDKVYTDDAYTEGNIVYITPIHEGFVKSILSDDTFLVKKGQLIIELDETNNKIEFERAKEHLADTVRQVCQNFHQVFAYKAEIQARKAEYVVSQQDYQHRINVLDAGGVSIEDFEHAEAALSKSFFLLQMTQKLYEKALASVQNTTLKNHPKILEAAQFARQAWVDLYRCKIYAPVDGLVAQRTIQVGMQVSAGTPLMGVIPLDQIWVNANYKETQLKKMRIGQKVKVTADLYGRDVVYHGTVVGLPGGAGNAFSLLPPQNLSGNWIKIVQRLPVRVAIDPEDLVKHPLRLGLSMESLVDLEDQSGLLVPDSTQGSPNYVTDIFKLEELGDEKWIETIVIQNIDPTLNQYIDNPLTIDE